MAKEKVVKVHDFVIHKYSCKQCISVDIDKTSTMSNCCLIGAPLLRDYLNTITVPVIRKRNAALKNQFMKDESGKTHRTSKQKLNEVMKYK